MTWPNSTRQSTTKQQRFAAEYMVDLSARQPAIRAGYSARTAEVQGSRPLRNAEVLGFSEKGAGPAAFVDLHREAGDRD